MAQWSSRTKASNSLSYTRGKRIMTEPGVSAPSGSPPKLSHASSVKPRDVRRAAFASSIGTALEAADFQIYGTASALVFAPVFFSGASAELAILLSFLTFAAGMIARPLGGIIFGHFGDRIGRRRMLVITLCGSALCAGGIGVLPGSSSLGMLAPILLVTLRLAQGIFHGGELGGAVLMAVENAPANRRGWYGSWTFAGSPGGSLLATGAISLTAATTGDRFLEWGWRLPFLFSLVLLAMGLYIRVRVQESPAFAAVRREKERARIPLAEVLTTSWRQVLLGLGTTLALLMWVQLLLVFALSYATGVAGVKKEVLLTSNLVGSALMIVATLGFARLSDHVGRKPVMLGGALLLVAWAFPFFALVRSGHTAAVVLAVLVAFVGTSAAQGPLPVVLVELFPTKVAYSGVSLGYQLGAVVGGLVPLVATALLQAFGGQSWPVSTCLMIGALITVACLFRLPTRRVIA